MAHEHLLRGFNLKRYLQDLEPGHKLYGANAALRCPKCERDQKLWVLMHDKSRGAKAGAWICYYCGDGGTTLLSLITRCSPDHILATLRAYQQEVTTSLAMVARSLLEPDADVLDDEVFESVPLPPEFIRYVDAPRKPAYFAERGIDAERAERYNLGFCERGYYANRLVVPIGLHGEHKFFVARYMQAVAPHGLKKTLYPRGSRPNRVLFNYDRVKHRKRITLVEDVFSAMHLGSHAVATLGTQFSDYQLELLLQTHAEEIVVMWDLDALDKAHGLAERLREYWRVRVVALPDIRDPDELSRDELRALVRASSASTSATLAHTVKTGLSQ